MKPTLLLSSFVAMATLLLNFATPSRVGSGFSKLPTSTIELGKALFHEPMLSRKMTISCASCHKPDFAFSDTSQFSIGVNGKPTGRNTPTVTYSAGRQHYFWDGRAATLEHQATGPITHPEEMNLTVTEAIGRLRQHAYYTVAFQKVFNRAPDSLGLTKALADFQRSLSDYDSPYDRYLKGDQSAMSASAVRGFYLFYQENTCAQPACHIGPDFSGDSLVFVGVHDGNDMGRYGITGRPEDRQKFKTPILRNVGVTGPYMHDGSMKTLREVIVFYNQRENFLGNPRTHANVRHQRAQTMTDQDVDDLVSFMNALTDYRYQKRNVAMDTTPRRH